MPVNKEYLDGLDNQPPTQKISADELKALLSDSTKTLRDVRKLNLCDEETAHWFDTDPKLEASGAKDMSLPAIMYSMLTIYEYDRQRPNDVGDIIKSLAASFPPIPKVTEQGPRMKRAAVVEPPIVPVDGIINYLGINDPVKYLPQGLQDELKAHAQKVRETGNHFYYLNLGGDDGQNSGKGR